MIHRIFTIFDSKMEAFLPIFLAPSTGSAIRSFEDLANKEGHQINRHSADYTLFEIGEFSDESASILSYATPVSLGVAVEFIKSSSQI